MPAGISQILSNGVRHIPVLAYEAIMTPVMHWAVAPADFQIHLDWLAAQTYAPQKLSDYIRWMRGEIELPKKSVVLTFWNAHKTVWTNAWPKLLAKNFKFALMVPGSVTKDAAELGSEIYLTKGQIATMVASGLAEVHSMGWHSIVQFKGAPLLAMQIHKAAQINLKWGGILEEVENNYSYAPFIGTNNSLQPVVTTYSFTCLPRSYRSGYLWPTPPTGQQALIPLQVVCRHLMIDQLTVQGTAPETLPLVKIYAKKSTDGTWTTLKTSWQLAWNQVWQVITLDVPFAFKLGVRYDLKFETQSAAPAAGELVSLGNWLAEGYGGTGTRVVSNSSVPPTFPDNQLGGDIYLLEDLSLETLAEVGERAKADAQKNLDYIAPLQPQGQIETAQAYYLQGFYNGTLFIPDKLRPLHAAQFWREAYCTDRWATYDLRNYTSAVVPFGWPQRHLDAAYKVSGLYTPAQIENTIDALAGSLWDVDLGGVWTDFPVRLGYAHTFSRNFYIEGAKYARAYSHISTKQLRFNPDGSFASGSQDNGISTIEQLATFMRLQFIREHPKVLTLLTNWNAEIDAFDPDIAHGIFTNATAAINSIINLVKNLQPTLTGVILDLEGCYAADKTIASVFIQQLWATMQVQIPGRVLINAIPAKTSEPGSSWSEWCVYADWVPNCTYANPLTYDYNWENPGPIAPISWMQNVMNFAATWRAKSGLLIGMQSYGHWAYWNGSVWGTVTSDGFYEYLRTAGDKGALWYWDATAKESYWQTEAVGETYWQGYGATPRGFKEKLEAFAGQGYGGWTNWAIGQGDALFHKYAEEITAIAPLVKLPSGVSQHINDREGSGSLGDFSVEVLERSRDVTITLPWTSVTIPHSGDLARIMQQQQLHGKKARLRMGYRGLNAPQFPVFDTLEVERVEVNEDQTGWMLQLKDPKRDLRGRIFRSATKDAPMMFAGNPMDILLMVCQNELGIGQNPNLSSAAWQVYDPTAGTGLINPNRYLDVPTILAYRNGVFRNYYLDFSITESQDGKQWLEREIFKSLGGYPVVGAQGRISVRFWIAPPLAGVVPVFTFTDHNLVELPRLERAPIVNQLMVRMDYDGSKFATIVVYVSGRSFSIYGLQGSQVIESRGLRSARQGVMHAALLATKLFRRYDSLTPMWKEKAQHQALTVEVGDLVALTHNKVLDPKTNQRGVSNLLCEVLDKEPDYLDATAGFKILDVDYLAAKHSYAVAPDGVVPDWPLASESQKDTYMFIAGDSTGLYSDGLAGHPIYG